MMSNASCSDIQEGWIPSSVVTHRGADIAGKADCLGQVGNRDLGSHERSVCAEGRRLQSQLVHPFLDLQGIVVHADHVVVLAQGQQIVAGGDARLDVLVAEARGGLDSHAESFVRTADELQVDTDLDITHECDLSRSNGSWNGQSPSVETDRRHLNFWRRGCK